MSLIVKISILLFGVRPQKKYVSKLSINQLVKKLMRMEKQSHQLNSIQKCNPKLLLMVIIPIETCIVM
ncbi:hypothetical protein AWM70_13205 [Paenibacillus yonginensis]|uniref:Uncharacterized protein n=1 Tax=Paenibacillus yonginensis TaxID=1462996 RepID=A0A1B1N1Z0_9BACL|nr:hypothetical protein AWM70_13205 [Paenibacillus yonginensis]